jgi:hypothetical protein
VISKSKIIIVLNLLSGLLISQQITYTSVPNIKDTFDYSEYSFRFNNRNYLLRSILPAKFFYSQIDNYGIPVKNYYYFPKLGLIKFANFSLQVGSKLFQLGAEADTPTLRGNILILNSEMSVF